MAKISLIFSLFKTRTQNSFTIVLYKEEASWRAGGGATPIASKRGRISEFLIEFYIYRILHMHVS